MTGEPGEALARLFDVRGLVVLVTGGASGLGRAIAQVLAGCGGTVITDRDEQRLAAAGLPAESRWTAASCCSP